MVTRNKRKKRGYAKLRKGEFERMIQSRQTKKAAERRESSLRLMQDYPGQYDCKDCIHGITGSCTNALPNGCEYFYDAMTGRCFEPEKHRNTLSDAPSPEKVTKKQGLMKEISVVLTDAGDERWQANGKSTGGGLKSR